MNRTIKTGLAAILLLANSCKKENNIIQTSRITGGSSTSDIITFNHDPGKYTAKKIGTQVWLQQNLAVTHYRNGDKIPQVKDKAQWAALTTGAWCWYGNDPANDSVYGKLYNGYAVTDSRGLAPKGWYIPSNAEWDTLSAHLGGDLKAGGKLKDTGTAQDGTGLWVAPNAKATNSSGFTGLPGSERREVGKFGTTTGYEGFWWSSTTNSNGVWVRNMYFNSGYFTEGYYEKHSGFSVRCIKDSI